MTYSKLKKIRYPEKLLTSIELDGKKTLVSGAASGIGRAISYRFAEAGSALILVDIDEKGLREVKKYISIFNHEIYTYKIDLCNKEEIDKLWSSILDITPDILINNAGIYPFQEYLKVNEVFYNKTLEVNLNSVFWMCQNFIRNRKNMGGIIVNISSIEAIIPFKKDMAHYSISKSGVYSLTRSLARDYGRKGFRVNGILPGAIKTPGTGSLVKMALRRFRFDLIKTGYDFNTRLALGRWGTPDEIARVVLFLSSDLSSYVQGAMIPVDGGFLSS
jgi:NAD(P)-dependent dehydrogenase (short-subunit alcohol dehydrogenase family)